MIWMIAQAKKRFSEMILNAQKEPQMISKRDTIVAAVINPDDYKEFLEYKKKADHDSLASAFNTLRVICAEENYEFVLPERTDRAVEWL